LVGRCGSLGSIFCRRAAIARVEGRGDRIRAVAAHEALDIDGGDAEDHGGVLHDWGTLWIGPAIDSDDRLAAPAEEEGRID
jgi:hypothetical protein